MKRSFIISALLLSLTLCLCFAGCGANDVGSISPEQVEDALKQAQDALVDAGEPADIEVVSGGQDEAEEAEEPEEAPEEEEPEEIREGFYRSELTNEWIDESLKNQRPIAVMIDNEIKALPHYATSQADIVYEMMNSTANDRITRLMCLFKDYNSLSQIGSIRSVRTTNLQIAPEYNAFVIHDGGPMYINAYFKAPFVEHISGGFARIKNGKPREFTEYITEGEITKRANADKISLEYNEYYMGPHFTFVREDKPIDLSEKNDSIKCEKIVTPYKHNKTTLEYISDKGVYRYSEYGSEYKDALTDDYMEFKNVILQESKFVKFDEHGYMNFLVHENEGMHGYYITNGNAIPITWYKNEYDMYPTVFMDADGEMIKLNTGKTYICIIPDDQWDELIVE